jgi:hypothetical protein
MPSSYEGFEFKHLEGIWCDGGSGDQREHVGGKDGSIQLSKDFEPLSGILAFIWRAMGSH